MQKYLGRKDRSKWEGKGQKEETGCNRSYNYAPFVSRVRGIIRGFIMSPAWRVRGLRSVVSPSSRTHPGLYSVTRFAGFMLILRGFVFGLLLILRRFDLGYFDPKHIF